MRILILIFTFAFVSAVQAGNDIQHRATCTYNVDNQCEVQFNIGRMAAAYFRVQQFDKADQRWFNIGDQPWQLGDTVETGYFYRVAGCDDLRGRTNCQYTRLFWAPVIVPAEQIPSRVEFRKLDGTLGWMDISVEEDLDSQLRQLNVYLMSATVSSAQGNIRGKMTQPAEHSHEAGLPHLENLIHHDVFDQYKKVKSAFSAE